MATICDYLDAHARKSPGKTVYSVLLNGEEEEQNLCYGDLAHRVDDLSHRLAALNLAGHRALLLYPDILEFIISFLACNKAGVVAVPVPYLKGSKQVTRLIHILDDAGASALLCSAASVVPLERDLGLSSTSSHIRVLSSDTPLSEEEVFEAREVGGASIAFIQYTSGSTGNPKGVVVTGDNLLHNQELIRKAFGCDAASVIFSWLPFHHDMGLIGNLLHTIYTGCSCVLMSPFHFIQNPRRWLKGITRYQITHSGGPNFAYDLCVEKIPPAEVTEYDLSTWKVAYNGSEAVRAATLHRFSAHFAAAGFRPGSFRPCYGMAEATLLISAQMLDRPPLTVGTEKGILISSGQVPPGVEIKILSPANGRECAEGVEGEICVAGGSVTGGYWNKNNSGLFHTHAGTSYLRTGDIGFVQGGDLFIHGRLKEMIIWQGKNFYPNDIEQALYDCHPAIEPNGVALFRIDDEREDFVVVAEIRRTAMKDLETGPVIRSIENEIAGDFGMRPYEILLTTPLGIPRTTSGKIQRLKCREYFNGNGFTRLGAASDLVPRAGKRPKNDRLVAETLLNRDRNTIRRYLVDLIDGQVGLTVASPAGDTTITGMGIDSLRATGLINNIGKDLGVYPDVAKIFADNTLEGLAGMIEEELLLQVGGSDALSDGEDLFPHQAVPDGTQVHPASNAQQRIWALSRLLGGNEAYTLITPLHLRGRLVRESLANAFRYCIRKHESLRTVFDLRDGILQQVILKDIPFEIEYRTPGTDTPVRDWLRKEVGEARGWQFDLSRGGLIRVVLYRLTEEEHALIIGLHHIVCDGQSINILLREVMGHYRCYCEGGIPAADIPGIQYRDYADWISRRIDSLPGHQACAYWKSQFPSGGHPLDLPTDHPRPGIPSFEGALAKMYPDIALTGGIEALCRQYGTTLFNVLRAALVLVLNRYTGQKVITIGSPAAGRTHFALQDAIGLFVNTLPLKAGIDEDSPFSGLLKAVAGNSFDAYRYQDYPFDRIVDDLALRRDISRNPLFDVMLVVQDSAGLDPHVADGPYGLTVSELDEHIYERTDFDRGQGSSKLDLTFNFGRTTDNRLYLELEYSTRLFDSRTIHRLVEAYLYCLARVCDQPEIRLKELDILPPWQRDQLLLSFNETVVVYPADETLVDLFAGQVERTPDRIAVASNGKELTYRELDRLSGQLADYLRNRYHLKKEDRIGIRLKRDNWMIVAILGVLKAGAAYVPMDVDYPEERIAFIIADSGCKLVVDEAELKAFRESASTRKRKGRGSFAGPGNLAYVIYTSGSTGRPKGVMIEHRSAVAFIHWCKSEFGHSDFDTVLGVTSICFDLSIFEIFYTLSTGKRLQMLPNALSITSYLSTPDKFLLNTVPSVVGAMLNENADLRAVKVLNMAGEPIPARTISGLDPVNTEIRNLYGPSEDTTYSTVYRIKDKGPVLIGRPIANTRIYILNEDRQPVPIGVAGEICIGGAGLARGYLNRPELTEEKFIANPFKDGERMYRTGDIGRWLESGDIEYLGRQDDQVKIRGFRIEPGEIENVLEAHSDIEKAIVVPRLSATGERELVAYWVGRPQVSLQEIRGYLKTSLPAYMIPARFVRMPGLPLTPSGKVDKKALAALAGDVERPAEYIAPGNPVEETLIQLWEQTLGRKGIGMKDNFFDLGGHSLKVMRLAGMIQHEFAVKPTLNELFIAATPEEQVGWILMAEKRVYEEIPVINRQGGYELSPGQQRLFVLSQFEEANRAYTMPGICVLEGPLDVTRLEQAFLRLIERYELLRTRFGPDESGEIRQFILPVDQLSFHIHYGNVEELTGPFDLASAPLFRVGLCQSGEDRWIFVFIMHHIISDGWSTRLLAKELVHYYNDRGALPPLRIQYKDYAAWQQEQLSGGALDGDRKFWLEQLKGALPVLNFPADRPRPAIKTYSCGVVRKRIGGELSARLETYSRRNKGTLFMPLLSVVNILLYRYSGDTDILVGTPVANRDIPELNDQPGLFINTIVARTQFSRDNSYRQLFDTVRQTALAAFEHAGYPFDRLVDSLGLRPDMSRNALFDVLVVLQDKDTNAMEHLQEMNGLRVSSSPDWENSAGKFDLSFEFTQGKDELLLALEYNSDLFDRSTAEKLADHFQAMAEAAMRHPDLPLDQLDYLAPAEKHQLLTEFNGKENDVPQEITVAAMIEEQSRRTPDRIALIAGEVTLTYKELDERANQLANFLVKQFPIERDDRVGIRLERNEWLVIAILAVLKSGSAYVPIDMDYPRDRIDYIIGDSGCSTVVDRELLEEFLIRQQEYSREKMRKEAGDLIYVIYTSGSSGRPKGAQVRQHSFVNLLQWYNRMLGTEPEDRVLLMAPVSFDLAQKNIFAPLIMGASLCLSGKLYLDYALLAEEIAIRGVTVVNAAPSAFYPLLDTAVNDGYRKLASIKNVVLGGEPIMREEMSGWLRSGYFHGRVINSYGPTECTDVVCAYTITEADWEGTNTIPIGEPVDNCKLYILDAGGNLVPVGVVGEIVVGGVCVGRGYLNQPDLTADKFVPDPWIPGGKMYRTGDLGRWLSKGSIEFLGRKDDQVKIRGYRVEPGEIEAALKVYPGIHSAVVVARPGRYGDKELVAYLVGTGEWSSKDLRLSLAQTLSPHLIPAHFVRVESIPLTPSGKVDRRTLALRDDPVMEVEEDYTAPRNETEAALISLWEKILGSDRIGITNNFFSLGGHSLKLIRLAGEIYRKFDVRLSFTELFRHPTAGQQAGLIREAKKTAYARIPVSAGRPYYPLSPSQRRIWILSQFPAANIAYIISGAFTFTGELDICALEEAFLVLIGRHDILRTVFRENEQGEPGQFILAPERSGFRLTVEDWRSAEDRDDRVQKKVREEMSHLFDLQEGPLLRAALYRTGEQDWVFCYAMHHIIGDGWSTGVLINELITIYNAIAAGKEYRLPPLPFQYRDYAVWQSERIKMDLLQEHRAYWLLQLGGELPVLELSAGRRRPPVKTYNGGVIQKQLNTAVTRQASEFGRQEGGTLFIALLAAVNALLHRYTGQEDIIVGSPVAGREHVSLEDQIGVFINTLALRTRVSGAMGYREIFGLCGKVALEANDHQAYPFDELIDELGLRRDTSRNALFDVMIILENADSVRAEDRRLGEAVIDRYEDVAATTSKVDLTFLFRESACELSLVLEYNSDIYDRQMAAALADHFECLFEAMLRDPARPVGELELLTEPEKQRLLALSAGEPVSIHRDATLVSLITEQVARTPDRVAVAFGDTLLTYEELDRLSRQFAGYLQRDHSVCTGDLVAVNLERNEWLVIVLLGVLRSGAAYVPIDPEYPEERIAYIIADSRSKMVIDAAELARFRRRSGAMDSYFQAPGLRPDDLAYIIYTSGSTGSPKGVMIEHQSVNAFIHWCAKEFANSDFEVVFGVTSVCFDLSVFEIFFTLTAGKKLRLLRNALSIPEYLDLDNKILLNTVPTVIGALRKEGAGLGRVTVLNMAGEPIPAGYIAGLDTTAMEVRNLYGPSEDTTYSTMYRIRESETILIGRPIANTRVYLLNESLQLQPFGALGEICLGGAGLARGYLNRPEWTAEKFIPDPFRPGERIYRTGDLGRWSADGHLVFAGRKDHQVKIRGYRIELSEIEAVLQAHDEVRSAVVVDRMQAGGDKILRAYIQPGGQFDAGELKTYLANRLPGFMIPNQFIPLEAFPLTPNGKIDRARLPEVEDAVEEFVEPGTETERRISLIWMELLGKDRIGLQDNFFQLGGHSLKAAQLISRINKEFAVRLNLQVLFEDPTLESIGEQVDFILHQQRKKEITGNLIQIEV